jgi:hypothetical protein
MALLNAAEQACHSEKGAGLSAVAVLLDAAQAEGGANGIASASATVTAIAIEVRFVDANIINSHSNLVRVAADIARSRIDQTC